MAWPDLLDPQQITDLDPERIAAASSRVRSYVCWHLAPSYSEIVTAVGDGVWRLDSRLITAVASVTDIDSGEVLTDIWFDGGLVGAKWVRSLRRVNIAFTHGFTVCPPDVVDFVRQLGKSGPTAPQVSQATVGQVAVSYREPSFSVLDDYRLPQIA